MAIKELKSYEILNLFLSQCVGGSKRPVGEKISLGVIKIAPSGFGARQLACIKAFYIMSKKQVLVSGESEASSILPVLRTLHQLGWVFNEN